MAGTRGHGSVFLALMALLLSSAAPADASDGAGHGLFSVSYQHIHADGFQATTGELPIGTIDTHTVNFEFEYQFSDRWQASVGIPLVTKRYQGPVAHDPRDLDPPREAAFIDDGSYHTDFQDWHLAIRYLTRTGNLYVEPFAALGVPSNDYPFFAHAAVGQNLMKFDLGAAFIYRPSLSNAWYRLDVSHVFVEETLGTNVDHWRINAEIGYAFTRRLAGRAFVLVKEGSGLEFPDDFPPPRTDEGWYQHDRRVKHNYVNAGLGLDFVIDERYRVSLSGLTMVHADQVHVVEYAFTVGLHRSF